MLPWLGYLRVSRVGDRKDTLISPELQERQITAYAERRGFEVEILEAELDVSGGKVERPILGQAIERIERGEAAGLIVDTLDRLSRMDMLDALQTIRRVEESGGQVIAVQENFDPTTPEGTMVRDVFLSVGNMQRRRYGGKIEQSKRQAVERGIWPIWVVPLGYRMKPREGAKNGPLEPDPNHAPQVVRAFEARASGASWREVGLLVDRGASGAGRLIANRVYLGEIRLRLKGGDAFNPKAHEPLVSRELWEAAQIAHPRPARSPGRSVALLAGLVRCANCRGLLSPTVNREWRGYRCVSGRQRAAGRCPGPAMVSARIDEYVTELFLEAAGTVGASAREREGQVEDAGALLTEAEAELAAYQEAVKVAEIGASSFASGMRRRVADVEAARRALAKARLKAEPIRGGGELRAIWPDLDVAERNQVLRGALGVVWVSRGKDQLADRVRVIAAGFEPRDLPRSGGTRFALDPVPGGDLPGQIGTAGA